MKKRWWIIAGVVWLALWTPALTSPKDFAALLGLLTPVLGLPLNALAWVTLLRESRGRSELSVLALAFVAASAFLVLAIVFSFIFVNNDTIPPWFGLAETKIVTRLTMLVAVTVPAAYLLRIWWRGRR